ncbi:hypothetical protein KR018_007142, partial [Drosophila ironensis]
TTMSIRAPLVQYKAGRMTLQGKIVQPDDRKGLLYLHRSSEDNLIYINWMDRRSGETELNLLAIPGTMEFRRVTECTTGRVFVLKIKESVRRYFFWMQDPHPQNDDGFCRRVNELISMSGRRRDEIAAADGDIDTDWATTEWEDIPGRGGGGSDTGPESEVSVDPVAAADFRWENYEAPGDVDPSMFQCVLEPVEPVEAAVSPAPFEYNEPEEEVTAGTAVTPVSPGAAVTPASPMTQAQMEALCRIPIDLANAMRFEWSEVVDEILTVPARRQQLLKYLPVNLRIENRENTDPLEIAQLDNSYIRDTLQSQEFSEDFTNFTYGLNLGIMSPMLANVLDEAPLDLIQAARYGDIEGFLRVLHRRSAPKPDN